jgi:phosphoglycolate phosphatase-like HAD superfamily hydrolase
MNIYLFDWGDTLMVDFPDVIGKMCDWEVVKAVSGAKEALEVLSKHSQIYVATGAADSTELEIKLAFERVGLSQFISGSFCKANLGLSKGSPEFLVLF